MSARTLLLGQATRTNAERVGESLCDAASDYADEQIQRNAAARNAVSVAAAIRTLRA